MSRSSSKKSAARPPSTEARSSRWLSALCFAAPLLIYIGATPLQARAGESGELLLALARGGLIHPPGYPLFWLLGAIPARLPIGTPHFDVAILCGALPTALLCWVLYRAARHLEVSPVIASSVAIAWGTSASVITLATRVEVYALHGALWVTALYAMLRFIKNPNELRWVFVAGAALALGAANHPLTLGSLLALPMMLLLTEWRLLFRPRIALTLLAIFIAALSLYALLPLLAALAAPDALVWGGGIHDLATFFAHVTASQSGVLATASPAHFGPGLLTFWKHWMLQVFPGAPLLALFGLWQMTSQSWPRRWLLVAALFLLPPALLLASSAHPDMPQLVTVLLAPLSLFTALGLEWFVSLDFWQKSKRYGRLRWLVMAIPAAVVLVHLALLPQVAQEGEEIEAVTRAVTTQLPKGALLLGDDARRDTWPLHAALSLDRHDQDELVLIDRQLFASQRWYRAWARERYPEVRFPAEAQVRPGWEAHLLRDNPTRQAFVVTQGAIAIPGLSVAQKGRLRRLSLSGGAR